MHLIQPDYSLLWGTHNQQTPQLPLGDIAIRYSALFKDQFPDIREGTVSQIPTSYFFFITNLLQAHTLSPSHPLLQKAHTAYPKPRFKNLTPFTHLLLNPPNILLEHHPRLLRKIESFAPPPLDDPLSYPRHSPSHAKMLCTGSEVKAFEAFFHWISQKDPSARFTLCSQLMSMETTQSNVHSFIPVLRSLIQNTPNQHQGIVLSIALCARLLAKRPDSRAIAYFGTKDHSSPQITDSSLALTDRIFDALEPHLPNLPKLLISTLATCSLFHSHAPAFERLAQNVCIPVQPDAFFSNPLFFSIQRPSHSFGLLLPPEHSDTHNPDILLHQITDPSLYGSTPVSTRCAHLLFKHSDWESLLFTPIHPTQKQHTIDLLFFTSAYSSVTPPTALLTALSPKLQSFFLDPDFGIKLQHICLEHASDRSIGAISLRPQLERIFLSLQTPIPLDAPKHQTSRL